MTDRLPPLFWEKPQRPKHEKTPRQKLLAAQQAARKAERQLAKEIAREAQTELAKLPKPPSTPRYRAMAERLEILWKVQEQQRQAKAKDKTSKESESK